MKRILIFAWFGLFCLVGCASPKTDMTSPEAMLTSIAKIKENLENDDKIAFEQALKELAGTEYIKLFENENPSSNFSIKGLLHNKSAKEIIEGALQAKILREKLASSTLANENPLLENSLPALSLPEGTSEIASLSKLSNAQDSAPLLIDKSELHSSVTKQSLSLEEIPDIIILQIASLGLSFPVLSRDAENLGHIDNKSKDYFVDSLPIHDRIAKAIASETKDYAIVYTDFNEDGLKDVFVQLKDGAQFILYWLDCATAKLEPFKFYYCLETAQETLKSDFPFLMFLRGDNHEILKCTITYYETASFGNVEGRFTRLDTSLACVEGENNFECDDKFSYNLDRLTEKWAYIRSRNHGESEKMRILPRKEFESTGFVWGSNVNVREGYGENYKELKVLYQLQNGHVVEIIEERDGWYRIDTRGWIKKDFVKNVPPQKKPKPERNNQIVSSVANETIEPKQNTSQTNNFDLADLDLLWSMPSSFLGQTISCFFYVHEIHEEPAGYNILVGDGNKIFDMKNPIAFSVKITKGDEDFVKKVVKLKGQRVILSGTVKKSNDLMNINYLDVTVVRYKK